MEQVYPKTMQNDNPEYFKLIRTQTFTKINNSKIQAMDMKSFEVLRGKQEETESEMNSFETLEFCIC
jgi:hypothetical protein